MTRKWSANLRFIEIRVNMKYEHRDIPIALIGMLLIPQRKVFLGPWVEWEVAGIFAYSHLFIIN